MRILFVEDDSMIGEAVFENLKEASYAVDWVRDGEAALSSIDVCPYDMVLLDLGLPKVDGMDVLKKIRSLKNNMPVLLITARDAVEDRIRGLDSGADDYIEAFCHGRTSGQNTGRQQAAERTFRSPSHWRRYHARSRHAQG